MKRTRWDRSGEKGIAMVTAIGLALIVSIMAAVVLNMTFRRFELSALRTRHAVAMMGSEAGFQYAFARLDRSNTVPPFRQLVRSKTVNAGTPTWYVVACHPIGATGTPDTLRNDAPELVTQMQLTTTDEVVPALHMGGKHVVVKIEYYRTPAQDGVNDNPRFTDRPYEVRSGSAYASSGGQ